MEGRGLRVLENDTTLLNKISKSLTKLLLPTKIGFNEMMISMKRSGVLRAYEMYIEVENGDDVSQKDALKTKYEESYILYLESIDKYIMDSIYKKVKNGVASMFEENALTNYYTVVNLKSSEYLEYKYRKQKFLLDLDYESVVATKREKSTGRFQKMYIEKIDGLYKGILKNYSVKLADGVRAKIVNQSDIYNSIFETLEEYIKNILPIKLAKEDNKDYSNILNEYEEYERFSVGKLDEKDLIEKKKILLGLSRAFFTHSLPLVAAEQCYNKLLTDTRDLIVKTKDVLKKDSIYEMLLNLIEEYNVKLLSTKVYWDKPEERETYKKFWDSYNNAKTSKEKEILALRRELYATKEESDKFKDIRKFYKEKLVTHNDMRNIKGLRKILGVYTKMENRK